MSTMLEQAIIDARILREVALKSAEETVVEKYAGEVKNAVEKLLEAPLEDEAELDLDLGAGMMPGEEEELEPSSVMGDVPFAHDPADDDDEIVIIDLDQIIAAAEADEGVEDESFELDVAEIADEVGIPEISPAPHGEELDPPAANRSDSDEEDDEIDINESDLLKVFKEMLTVDVDERDVALAEEEAEEEKKEEPRIAKAPTDGMDKKDIEARTRLNAQLESTQKENKNLKKILAHVKGRLEEINLSNARLLYTNRVLRDSSLNEQQKKKIADMINETQTVDEAKMIFETLQKTMASTSSKNSPKSLSEAVSRSSTIILSGQRRQENAEESPVTNRWAKLAGINNKN